MVWGLNPQNAGVIQLDSDEYALEYTTLHNEFKELFEAKLEGEEDNEYL